MKKAELLMELIATYRKHGWEFPQNIKEGPIDALWFSRPSHSNREAWELRLLSETQYALFESFEDDETDEQREEMRQEMEARMRDHVLGG